MASLEGATHDDTQAQMDRRPHPIDDNTTYAASAQQLEAADTEGETAGAGPLQDPATDEGPASAAASSAVASVAKDTSGLVSIFAENTVSNAATEAATAGAGAGAADHPEVDHTAVPAAPPAPAVAVDENMVLDVQLTGQFLKQNGEQIAAAPAITTSPARNSSTADPTVQEVAPAGASDNEAAADPPVIHASSSDTATQDAPAVNVRELREHLSATRIPLTAQMAPPPKAPSPQPKPQPALPVSEHDTVNTVNVAALLASADFKKVPGQDVIPYEDLITLRLEDGIDVTRKEEYLSSDDFTKVFGCNREAYAQMPQWKRLQIKRSVKLF